MFRFLVLMALTLTFSAQSSELSGLIEKGLLTWSSAKVEGGGVTPYSWGFASRLPAANKITLGGFDSGSTTTLTLNGPGGKVSVPLSIKGMSYKLSDYSALTNGASGLNAAVSGNLVKIMGSGVGKATFTLSSLSSPITHYQPIINSVNSSSWVQAFESAKVGKGVYLGSFPYSFSYLYERDGVTIKHTVSAKLAFQVNYEPATISSILLTGSGIMTPIYYGYPERKVRGATDYNVTISGYFPWGIKMGLKRAAHYQLRSASYSPQKNQDAINYSVKCKSGCQGGIRNIITSGNANINDNNNRLKVGSLKNKNTQVVIEVSFNDKKLSELEGGIYMGSFVLNFEAGL